MLSDEEIVLKRLKETLDVLKGKNVITRLDFQIRDMVEGCIRVIEEQQKNNENWKKYCDEQENDITLKNNKICDLEFKIEKQSKEIEELKKENKEIRDWKYVIDNPIDLDKLKELDSIKIKGKEYISKNMYEELEKDKKALINNYSNVLGEFIPKDKIKAKIEEVKDGIYDAKIVLQSLLEKE